MGARSRWVVALLPLLLLGCADAGPDTEGVPGYVDRAQLSRALTVARYDLARWDAAEARGGPGAAGALPAHPGGDVVLFEPPMLSATAVGDGRTVYLTFTGGGGHATEPCGVDYTALAVESRYAIVLVVVAHHFSATPELCHLDGHVRHATARLAEPLANRAVLGVANGLPVPGTLG